MNDITNINLSPEAVDVQRRLTGLTDQLDSVQQQVRSLQRLASLGTMSAMLAHEINNILTPIVSYAQYALKRGDAELMRTAVEKMIGNAERMTGLCHRVLGLAAEQPASAKSTPIAPLVHDAVEGLGRGLDRDNITLVVNVPSELTVRAHAGGLQQVLYNLVLNARQAMLDTRGTLTILARPVSGGRVKITVSDTGPGIAAEHLERVFEPFFSTKQQQDRPDRSGVGLGLSICKQIVTENGGTIEVESRPGNGAKFVLTLPAGEPVAT